MMAAEDGQGEDELETRQGPGLYPIGRALRATYDAENHDSLGNDLTGLMLELARVGPPPAPPAPVQRLMAAPPPAQAPAAPTALPAPSLIRRLIAHLRHTA